MAHGQLARPVPPWGEADEIGRWPSSSRKCAARLRDRLRSTESINVDLEREVRRRTEALEQRNAELARGDGEIAARAGQPRAQREVGVDGAPGGRHRPRNQQPGQRRHQFLGPLDEAVKRIAAGEGGSPIEIAKEAEEILAVVQRGAARTKAIVQALHGYARGDDSVQREVNLARSVDDTLGCSNTGCARSRW
jgi:hypothetical protein